MEGEDIVESSVESEEVEIDVVLERYSSSEVLTVSEAERVAQVTEAIAQYCVSSGRCVFPSLAGMLAVAQLPSDIQDDAGVLSEWHKARALCSLRVNLESFLREAPKEGTTLFDAVTTTTSGAAGPLVSVSGSRWSLWRGVTTIAAPLMWTWSTVERMALWPWRRQSAVQRRVAPSTSKGVQSSSKYFHDRQAHPRGGFVYLPGLQQLGIKAMKELESMHPYNNIFQLGRWEDFLLDQVGIRHGDIVSEFLAIHNCIALSTDTETSYMFVFHADRCGRTHELAAATRTIGHWKCVTEFVDDHLIRWETHLQELEETGRDATPTAEALRTAIAENKLVQLQLSKIDSKCEDSTLDISIEQCAAWWTETIEENFPDALRNVQQAEARVATVKTD